MAEAILDLKIFLQWSVFWILPPTISLILTRVYPKILSCFFRNCLLSAKLNSKLLWLQPEQYFDSSTTMKILQFPMMTT